MWKLVGCRRHIPQSLEGSRSGSNPEAAMWKTPQTMSLLAEGTAPRVARRACDSRWRTWLALSLLVALGGTSCASMLEEVGGSRIRRVAPEPDSLTLALWHMDETSGTLVQDAGPHHLDGVAGPGTDVGSGYTSAGRRFTGDTDAYMLVPWKPPLRELSEFTVEASNRLSETSGNLRTIAAQWTSRELSSSWYFGVIGADTVRTNSQGDVILRSAHLGSHHLVFAYVSTQHLGDDAVRVVMSEKALIPGIWTHVAVTFDGTRVRFYRDHKPDWTSEWEWEQMQEETRRAPDQMRKTETPLTIGNYFETFLPQGPRGFSYTAPEGVAFSGEIDELRISHGVRGDLVVESKRDVVP